MGKKKAKQTTTKKTQKGNTLPSGPQASTVHLFTEEKKPFSIICSVDIVNCDIPCTQKLLILIGLWKSGAIPWQLHVLASPRKKLLKY